LPEGIEKSFWIIFVYLLFAATTVFYKRLVKDIKLEASNQPPTKHSYSVLKKL
jgi:hypothetical protein